MVYFQQSPSPYFILFCLIHKLCAVISVLPYKIRNPLKIFYLYVSYIRVLKKFIKDKLFVLAYLLTIGFHVFMYRILQVNTFTSESILTSVQSYNEYSDMCMNMLQMSSTSVRVCQLTPNYIRA